MELDTSTSRGKTTAANWYNSAKVKNKKIKERIDEGIKRTNQHNLDCAVKDKLRLGEKVKKPGSKLLCPSKSRPDVVFKYPYWRGLAVMIHKKIWDFLCGIEIHDWYEMKKSHNYVWYVCATQCHNCGKTIQKEGEENG